MCKRTATVALILVIIGALNWGFIGISGVNAVEAIVGSDNGLADIIYIVVGLAGLYSFMLFKPLGLFEGRSCCLKGEKKEKTACCSMDEETVVSEKGCCKDHTQEKAAKGECCKHK